MIYRNIPVFSASHSEPSGSGMNRQYCILAGFIFLGVTVGSVAGIYLYEQQSGQTLQSFIAEKYPAQNLLTAFLNASQYLLVLLFLSTSYVGAILVPLILTARGYLFGCSVAVLYKCFGFAGLRISLLIQGIPSLILTPCLLLTAAQSIGASAFLLRIRFGAKRMYDTNSRGFQYIILAITVILGTAYNYFLLPRLLA